MYSVKYLPTKDATIWYRGRGLRKFEDKCPHNNSTSHTGFTAMKEVLIQWYMNLDEKKTDFNLEVTSETVLTVYHL